MRTLLPLLVGAAALGCASSAPPPELQTPATLRVEEAPAARGVSEAFGISIAAPIDIVLGVAADPARYFVEVADLGEARVVDKTTDGQTEIYVAADVLDGAVRFFSVLRFRIDRRPWGARIQGRSVRGNVGDIAVDGAIVSAGQQSRLSLRIALDPILPIPEVLLHEELARIARRSALILRRESELRAHPQPHPEPLDDPIEIDD